MKKSVKFLFIAFLCLVLIYICKIDSIPTSSIIYKGDNLDIGNFFGISLLIDGKDCNSVLASNNFGNSQNEAYSVSNVNVKLFDIFNVKDINLNIIEQTTVIPVGQISGLKLYTSGVLVVGMSEIKSIDNQKYKPYENSGIEEGNRILKINDIEISDTQNLQEIVNNSNGNEIQIEYAKNNEIYNTSITPIKYIDGTYKLGLWVRDTAAGIGTLTFYEPSTGNFAALGHGIEDIDTGELVEISNGEFLTTKILSIIKGTKGNPGKVQGTIENQKTIGNIYKNSNLGIYGTLSNLEGVKLDFAKEIPVAKREEIKVDKAYIYCSLDGEKAKEYEIKIQNIYLNNNSDNKSMLIKVIDENLINQTGGIIQGMSGSPIIQNGKFIGAITNVLVNDPTQGYAVFGDIMIKEMNNK